MATLSVRSVRAQLRVPCATRDPRVVGQHHCSMDIIPVIDLKGGIVVHARRGERHHYRALQTPFASRPEPLAVVDGLLAFQDFRHLYVADLDAIAGRGEHMQVVREIARRYPQLRVWLDAGLTSPACIVALPALANIDVVLGSESLLTLNDYHALRAAVTAARSVLSLDRGARGETLGCGELFEAVELWPARVIHMTLARVGVNGGPDFDGLAGLRAQAPHCAFYAAGGVRDEADLDALAAQGVAGALVATALHDGRIRCARR